ncbi:MAG: ABC transporter ATP-binding protein [Clostridia bacterium]
MKDVRIEKLEVNFGPRTVLQEVSLSIEKGRFVTIVGPNGCGKTTLLRSITAAVKKTGGAVYLHGTEVEQLAQRERAKSLAVVPQNTDVAYEFSCYDVVMMGRYAHIKRWQGEQIKDREMVEVAMMQTNVAYLRDRKFTEISGGERQRVILAQALAGEPTVVLLDEPVSNLDPQYQIEILDTMKRLSVEKKLTVIAVLHDLNLASMYSDEIIMLQAGKVVGIGTPEVVLTKENIERVFATEVLVSPSPVMNKPHIYAKSKGFFLDEKEKLHLICGGGSGTPYMHQLFHLGYQLSVCVLNEGDLDWQTLKEFGLPMLEEKPFAPISPESYQAHLKLLQAADAIIVCPSYFSPANLPNLTILLEPVLAEKKVYLLASETSADRDFAAGEVTRVYQILSQRPNCEQGLKLW